MSTFTTECYQNEYLPLGGSEVNAIVTVTSDGAAVQTSQPEAAEIVIIDTSGSMGAPRRKLEAAREATGVAIDCIRDGVAFGVIAGTEAAAPVYPSHGEMALASAQTRSEAKQALRRLKAKGGTAIGSWLTAAALMFATVPGRSCHAILLTDGENQHESDMHLDGVLSELEGRFQCDCRGVGTDWRVSELRRVASALLGSVDIIAKPEDMAEDFRALMRTAMGKSTGNVSLPLWTPHYTGQAELADCIQDGLEARKEGDLATATFKLGRAVKLAAESGNDGTMKLLQAVVEVDDAATGTIRLRHDVATVDEMSLDTRSTITVRVGSGAT